MRCTPGVRPQLHPWGVRAVDAKEVVEEYARGTPTIARMGGVRAVDAKELFEEYARGTPTVASMGRAGG